jgi:MFS family permease
MSGVSNPMRELFRHRDFRLLLAGQTLSMFGEWTLLLVFGIWAKTLTGSNAIAGLTVFAMVAPGLLAPFAGVVVDRLPRRAVMIGLNLISATVVCSLWLVEDRDQLWLLFAVIWVVVAAIQVGSILAFSGEPDKAIQPVLYGVAVPAVAYFLAWIWNRLRK